MQFNIPAEHKNASGVYIIRNTVNDKVYVGSAVKFRNRFYSHKSALVRDCHHSQYLQNFVNKYGLSVLLFELLELVCEVNAVVVCEQKWINYYDCCNSDRGFNCSPTAGSTLGRKCSPDTRAKIAAKATGRKPSNEARQQMRESQVKRQPASEETRARLSAALKGKVRSDEQKAKLSEAAKTRAANGGLKALQEGLRLARLKKTGGKELPPEEEMLRRRLARNARRRARRALAKQREETPRRTHSEETKRKLSVINTGKTHSAESRAKMSESRKGKSTWNKGIPMQHELKAKIIAANTGSKRSEETKAKMSASRRLRPYKPLTEEHKQKSSKFYKGIPIAERRNLDKAPALHQLSIF